MDFGSNLFVGPEQLYRLAYHATSPASVGKQTGPVRGLPIISVQDSSPHREVLWYLARRYHGSNPVGPIAYIDASRERFDRYWHEDDIAGQIIRILQDAQSQFETSAGHPRIKFRLFSPLTWLMTGGVPSIERPRALTIGLAEQLVVKHPVLRALRWVLAVVFGWIFLIAVTGRVPVLSGRYRWFMRQPYLTPSMSGNFLRFARRLTPEYRKQEAPEQVINLLISAYLEDLRRAYRFRPWHLRNHRQAHYPLLVLDRVDDNSSASSILAAINSVRNQQGVSDPLLIIATADAPPPGLDRRSSAEPDADLLLYFDAWATHLTARARKRDKSAWFLPITVSGTVPWPTPVADSSRQNSRWIRSVTSAIIAVIASVVAVFSLTWWSIDRQEAAVVRLALGAGTILLALSILALVTAVRRASAQADLSESQWTQGPKPVSLTEVADRYLGRSTVTDHSGTSLDTVVDRYGIERSRLEPILAARLWYLLDSTPAPAEANGSSLLRRQLLAAGASTEILHSDVEFVIVPHGAPETTQVAARLRYDLVVFDPGPSSQPQPTVVEMDMSALLAEVRLQRSVDSAEDWLAHLADTATVESSTLLLDAALTEASRNGEYAVLLLPAVARRPEAGPGAGGLAVSASDKIVGTVGITAMNKADQVVATTARHCVSGHRKLTVNGRTTLVVAEDAVVDCCVLDSPQQTDFFWPATSADVLNLTPRIHEIARFHGARSGIRPTRVTGFDLTLLWHGRHTAVRVYTDADTRGGDSGAALVDSDGRLMGFCCERTAWDAPIHFTSWIWAQQVLDLMDLRVAKRSSDDVVDPRPDAS